MPTVNPDRRDILRMAGSASLTTLLVGGCSRRPVESQPSTALGAGDPVLRFPGKVPLRVIDDRPPCLETPWKYYREDLTPNEAFYVRWHLQTIPTSIDTRTW